MGNWCFCSKTYTHTHIALGMRENGEKNRAAVDDEEEGERRMTHEWLLLARQHFWLWTYGRCLAKQRGGSREGKSRLNTRTNQWREEFLTHPGSSALIAESPSLVGWPGSGRLPPIRVKSTSTLWIGSFSLGFVWIHMHYKPQSVILIPAKRDTKQSGPVHRNNSVTTV